MSKTDAKQDNPTVVIEAAKPYAMKNSQGSASSAPAVDESQVTDLKKGIVVPDPNDVKLVPWNDTTTLVMMVVFSIVGGMLVPAVGGINLATNSEAGILVTIPFIFCGSSFFIYHGFMDGPLRDSKTGEYLPLWNVAARASVCGWFSAANICAAVFVHQNMGLLKIISSAACWVTLGLYAAFGLWLLCPIPFMMIMVTVAHAQYFGFYMTVRTVPIVTPWLVMATNMSMVTVFGWSMRSYLDDTGTIFWAIYLTPLLGGYNNLAFIQIIGSPVQSVGMKILMVISNILNSVLTPDVKTILYSKMGMKLEIYDVNAMYLLDAFSWVTDIKFILTLPILYVFGILCNLDAAVDATIWPLLRDNFVIIWVLYTLQTVLGELVVYSMKFASKYVNVNRAKDVSSRRVSHMQIGARGSSGHTGRYYYSQLREDAKYYHPWLAMTVEICQPLFLNWAMEEIYRI